MMKPSENQAARSRSRQSLLWKARKICVLGILGAVLASGVMTGRSAFADNGKGNNGNGNGNNGDGKGNNGDGKGKGSGVPEIDPGMALSALTLLGGGALLLSDRRRRTASAH